MKVWAVLCEQDEEPNWIYVAAVLDSLEKAKAWAKRHDWVASIQEMEVQ